MVYRVVSVLIFCTLSIGYSARHSHYSPSVRIINGQEAVPNSAPFIVMLLLNNGTDLCGGSLISPNYVLTAGHCLLLIWDMEIILGVHNWTMKEPHQLRFRVNDSAYIFHEKFDSDHLLHDIGLVKLPQTVQTNKFIQIAKLPARNESVLYYEKAVRAYGWGLTYDPPVKKIDYASQVLMYLDSEVMYFGSCWTAYRNLKYNSICTPGTGTVGTCDGDSGTPLMLNDTQIAFTSNGPSKCEGGGPSVYIKLSFYLDWIANHSDAIIN